MANQIVSHTFKSELSTFKIWFAIIKNFNFCYIKPGLYHFPVVFS